MTAGFIQDATLEAMDRYLSRLSRRQEVIASNISNIDTPGYAAKDISFHATMEELLNGSQKGLRATRPEHLATGQWNFAPVQTDEFEVSGLTSRPDGNNVDIDREMLKLAETSFGYSMIVQLLRSKFRIISSSINEGRIG